MATLTEPSLLQEAMSFSLGLMRRHVHPAIMVSSVFIDCPFNVSPEIVSIIIGKSKNVVTT